MSEDDWFERALRESDEEPEDGETSAEEGSADVEEGAPDADAGAPAAPGDGEGAAPASEDDDGLFDDDFGTAFGEAGDVSMDDGVGGMGPGDGGMGPPSEGGMGAPGDGGPGEEFAFGGTGESAEFPDEDADSDLDRIDLGVEGLDDMIRGGVPDRSLMTVIGSAGTGKTTLGLQFLQHGLAAGDRCVYITLEESRERVLNSAAEKGWDFREHLSEGRLAIVDIDPVEMANSLKSIRSDLPRLIDDFGAERLVLDSVSLLELMYEDRAKRRNEIYEFTRSLKNAGVTTLLTSEASDDNPYASRHGIVEYLTDAVFIMQYVRPSDFRETRLAIEIQKIRDADHSREMKPYEITDGGLNVYRQANIF